MNSDAELQKLWKAAIGQHLHSEDFREVIHRQAIEVVPYETRIAIERSCHGVLKAAEGTVWIVSIVFEPIEADIENLKEYARCIHARTGITWIRVAHESNGYSRNIMVDPGLLITSEKLGE